MLKEFLSWWAEQMLAWLPRRLRAGGDAGRSNAVLVAWRAGQPPHLEIATRRDGQEAAAGSFVVSEAGLAGAAGVLMGRGKPAAIVLRGAPGQLLERQVALPLAAERDLGRALAYEMGRLTPFDADELFWSCAVERRDRGTGTLHLRLSLVARASVQKLIDALGSIGAVPGWLEAPTGAGVVRRIDLAAPQAGTRQHRVVRLAAAVCGCLALVAAGLPFVVQSLEFAAVEARIERLQPEMAQVEALRRRIAGEGAGTDVVTAERARVGDALEVLATITDLLPDDTVLTDFSLSQGKLSLGGVSSAASRLIAILAGAARVRNPTFVAPVTRAEAAGDGAPVDRFAIRAELAP